MTMVSHRFFLRRISTLQLNCRVCGDRARGFNFDVLTCMSCKAFFRRNALYPPGKLRCKHNGFCVINKQNRKKCASCRLQKCLTYGMKIGLIRSPIPFNVESLKNDCCETLPFPQTINIHSPMTLDEWNHLSKVIHAYDRYNVTDRLEDFRFEQSSLPVKLRAKRSMAMNFMYLSIQSIVDLLRQSFDFENLSIETRRSLIEQNIYFSSYFNAIFLGQVNELWHNSDFQMSINNLYGVEFVFKCTELSEQLDSNDLLVKMFLVLLIFSSNYSIVFWKNSSMKSTIVNNSRLLLIEDFYAKLLWKYLDYQYGFTEAVLRYASMMKIATNVLDLMKNSIDEEDFQEMILKISSEIEDELIVKT